MRAEIVSIGTEIMLGEITDTNAQFIASKLPAFGIDLMYVTQVGDNPRRLQEVLARAWERSDIIFTTGGLGPTEDDVTRECIAAVLGETLERDVEQERVLRAWFEGRGRPLVERNLKQAMLIPSARALPNPRGTAPGWWVERDGHSIVAMPGPPPEMTDMWERQVDPVLEERADGILVSRTLKTVGFGEALVDERMSPLAASANPSIGIYARRDGVSVRISAKAASREEAWLLIRPVEEEARQLLDDHLWGVDDETMAGAIGRMLREQKLTLALMESATAGAIADEITNSEGSTEYFRGSMVTYATQAKIDMGVPGDVLYQYGVISRQTAEAMATAARERMEADIGLGITGIAGSSEMEGQPPGTMHIAVSDGRTTRYHHSAYYQGRQAAKRRAVLEALSLLRDYLMERERTG